MTPVMILVATVLTVRIGLLLYRAWRKNGARAVNR